MTTFGTACSIALLAASLGASVNLRAAESLRLNPHLDYSSDSQDGPLITGDRIEDGDVRGKPNYVFIFGEGCYNSKRQARRTVSLYEKYRGRVRFVIIDLDKPHSTEQQSLIKGHYQGFIPHVTILDAKGNSIYDKAGEVSEADISRILDALTVESSK
jgi:hypothetical protein